MGQIVQKANNPVRCNLAAIQSGGSKAGTVLASGEIWLVDTTNASKGSKGYGKYDAYIKGDGVTAASGLDVVMIDAEAFAAIESLRSSTSIGIQAAMAAVSAEQQRAMGVEATKYSKPAGGIPKVDLASDVRNALDLATDVVYDISAHNNNTAYASLAAALGTGGANIPQSLRKGGMSVKFVLSSDNKYVQSRYMGTSTAAADFTNVANWQVVDDEPEKDSSNLVTSGGVAEKLLRFCKLYPTLEIKDGYFQLISTGAEVENSNYFLAKGFVVKGWEKLYISRTVGPTDSGMGICFYDETKTNKLGYAALISANNTIDVPDGAYYANISFKWSVFNASEQFIVRGFSKYTSKELYSYITQSSEGIYNYINNSIKPLVGFFDISSNLTSGYINNSGRAIEHSSYAHTDFISIGDDELVRHSLKFGLKLFINTAIAIYSAANESSFLFAYTGTTSSNQFIEGEIDLSLYPTAKYFRATIFEADETFYVRLDKSNGKAVEITTDDIADSAITTAKLSDSSVTDAKLNNSAVTEAKINVGAVTNSKLGAAAVTNDKIADGTIGIEKVAFKEHDEDTNFIDKTKLTAGYYIGANGVPAATPSSNYWITDKVYLEAGGQYYWGNLYRGYYAFYEEDGTLVEYHSSPDLATPFTVPQGAAYGRFTINVAGGDETCWIAKTNSVPVDYAIIIAESVIPKLANHESRIQALEGGGIPTEYMGNDMSVFNKILCIGDSLTEGAFNYLVNGSFGNGTTASALGRAYSFPQYLAKITGCEVTNLGKSGYTSTMWYDYYTTGDGAGTDFTGYDCAIIQLGVNDNGSTLDTVSRQALINIINLLKTNNSGIKIFFAGIINAKSYKAATEGEGYYNKDQFLRSFYNELYASDNQVFFIDHVAYGHLRDLPNVQHGGSYAVDNYNEGHLSAYGYWRLAQDYKSYIGYIMHNDTTGAFRAIQFIGTEYECY